MVASSEPMYDSIKLKLVCVSSGAPRLFDAVQDGVTDPSHSADSIGLNEKQIVAILYELCYGLSEKCNWFECDHAVVLKDCHLNQQDLVLSISQGAPATGKRQMKFFHKLSSCNTRNVNELVSGAILHNWQLVQLMYTTVYTKCQPYSGKQSAPKFMCTCKYSIYDIQSIKRIISIGK